MRRIVIPVLLLLNLVMLLGQLWPEGAPPFARTINIIVLVGNIALLGRLVIEGLPRAE